MNCAVVMPCRSSSSLICWCRSSGRVTVSLLMLTPFSVQVRFWEATKAYRKASGKAITRTNDISLRIASECKQKQQSAQPGLSPLDYCMGTTPLDFDYNVAKKSNAAFGIPLPSCGGGAAKAICAFSSSSRTALRTVSSSRCSCSLCSRARTMSALRFPSGAACKSCHARRSSSQRRLGRNTNCGRGGRFTPRSHGPKAAPTRARIRPRSPCHPAGTSRGTGRLWGRRGAARSPRRRPA